MIELIVMNLEKIGAGVALFLIAYVANMCLGAYKNVKIEGYDFDWELILQSVAKFAVLGVGIGLLSVAITVIPHYATYVGIVLEESTMTAIDSLVIVGAFLTAAIKYIADGVSKIKTILGG